MLNKLKLKYPIIQAPMAGVTTPELVAAVSNYGALGNIGAGYLRVDETKDFIKSVRNLTTKAFGINLFVPEDNVMTKEEEKLAFSLMTEHLKSLGEEVIESPKITSMIHYEKQVNLILEERVPVCSFTFGIPDEHIVRELKKRGIMTIGTATTVKEAQKVEAAGLDLVVVQGSEAGGHRGTFLQEEHYIGTMALVPQVADQVNIPVIAAGGIMDGRGLMAALNLGATAAQFGTAFLTTKESAINETYKEALLQATEDEVLMTKAFSGKTAQGLNNEFIQSMKKYEDKLPPFPYQNAFTKEMRQIAGKEKNKQYMSLWSGQAVGLTKNLPVKELLDSIIQEYNQLKTKMTLL